MLHTCKVSTVARATLDGVNIRPDFTCGDLHGEVYAAYVAACHSQGDTPKDQVTLSGPIQYAVDNIMRDSSPPRWHELAEYGVHIWRIDAVEKIHAYVQAQKTPENWPDKATIIKNIEERKEANTPDEMQTASTFLERIGGVQVKPWRLYEFSYRQYGVQLDPDVLAMAYYRDTCGEVHTQKFAISNAENTADINYTKRSYWADYPVYIPDGGSADWFCIAVPIDNGRPNFLAARSHVRNANYISAEHRAAILSQLSFHCDVHRADIHQAAEVLSALGRLTDYKHHIFRTMTREPIPTEKFYTAKVKTILESLPGLGVPNWRKNSPHDLAVRYLKRTSYAGVYVPGTTVSLIDLHQHKRTLSPGAGRGSEADHLRRVDEARTALIYCADNCIRFDPEFFACLEKEEVEAILAEMPDYTRDYNELVPTSIHTKMLDRVITRHILADVQQVYPYPLLEKLSFVEGAGYVRIGTKHHHIVIPDRYKDLFTCGLTLTTLRELATVLEHAVEDPEDNTPAVETLLKDIQDTLFRARASQLSVTLMKMPEPPDGFTLAHDKTQYLQSDNRRYLGPVMTIQAAMEIREEAVRRAMRTPQPEEVTINFLRFANNIRDAIHATSDANDIQEQGIPVASLHDRVPSTPEEVYRENLETARREAFEAGVDAHAIASLKDVPGPSLSLENMVVHEKENGILITATNAPPENPYLERINELSLWLARRSEVPVAIPASQTQDSLAMGAPYVEGMVTSLKQRGWEVTNRNRLPAEELGKVRSVLRQIANKVSYLTLHSRENGARLFSLVDVAMLLDATLGTKYSQIMRDYPDNRYKYINIGVHMDHQPPATAAQLDVRSGLRRLALRRFQEKYGINLLEAGRVIDGNKEHSYAVDDQRNMEADILSYVRTFPSWADTILEDFTEDYMTGSTATATPPQDTATPKVEKTADTRGVRQVDTVASRVEPKVDAAIKNLLTLWGRQYASNISSDPNFLAELNSRHGGAQSLISYAIRAAKLEFRTLMYPALARFFATGDTAHLTDENIWTSLANGTHLYGAIDAEGVFKYANVQGQISSLLNTYKSFNPVVVPAVILSTVIKSLPDSIARFVMAELQGFGGLTARSAATFDAMMAEAITQPESSVNPLPRSKPVLSAIRRTIAEFAAMAGPNEITSVLALGNQRNRAVMTISTLRKVLRDHGFTEDIQIPGESSGSTSPEAPVTINDIANTLAMCQAMVRVGSACSDETPSMVGAAALSLVFGKYLSNILLNPVVVFMGIPLPPVGPLNEKNLLKIVDAMVENTIPSSISVNLTKDDDSGAKADSDEDDEEQRERSVALMKRLKSEEAIVGQWLHNTVAMIMARVVANPTYNRIIEEAPKALESDQILFDKTHIEMHYAQKVRGNILQALIPFCTTDESPNDIRSAIAENISRQVTASSTCSPVIDGRRVAIHMREWLQILDADFIVALDKFRSWACHNGPLMNDPEDTTPPVPTTRHQVSSAAYRIAARQTTRLSRDVVAAMIAGNFPGSQSMKEQIVSLLQTQAGTDALMLLIGSIIPTIIGEIPDNGDADGMAKVATRLSRELRIEGLTGLGDSLVEQLTGPLRNILLGLMKSEEAQATQATQAKVNPSLPMGVVGATVPGVNASSTVK